MTATILAAQLVPFVLSFVAYFVASPDGSKPIWNSIGWKCAPIVALCVLVLLNTQKHNATRKAYSRRILLGLMFSCVGDALLVYPNHYFELGVVVFAAAQIIYTSAYGFNPLDAASIVPCSLFGVFWYWAAARKLTGVLHMVVVIYLIIIMVMFWRALARVRGSRGKADRSHICSLLGSISFVFSDFVLSVDHFETKLPYSNQLIMVSYYLAQLGISLSSADWR